MENLIFSLNATIPIFLTMVAGFFFHAIGIIDDDFASKLNKFVFKIALPVLLFQDLGTVNFTEVWDTRFVLFCFFVTLFCICLIIAISYLLKDRALQGEFIQAAYRSSAAILGLAFIQNIYGNTGMAPLMIVASVPLYNIMAVVVLSIFNPANGKMTPALMKKTLFQIITNPILIGIVVGLLWSVLGVPLPAIAAKTIKNVAVLATPLGLISMGASFKLESAASNLKPAIVASTIKLVILAAVFLPFAVLLGFRTEKLIAILVMLGSSTTVSSYIMARNMGHEGSLTANAVMLTTLFSAFTLTFWLFLLRTMQYI